MQKYYEFYNPTKILCGKNALENIGYELLRLQGNNPVIITDQKLYELGHPKLVQMILEDFDIFINLVIKDVPTDSSISLASKYAQLCIDVECDSIIAIGGGSVLDMAKAINLLVSKKASNLLDLQGANIIIGALNPFIAIPTTSGSGSEVTKIFVASDRKTKTKKEFVSESFYPDVAILDIRMIDTMPRKITAISAVDALVQGIEAYTSLQKNPLSDSFSTEAIRLICRNINLALFNNKKGRIALANAALMAGIALSNSMVGMIHAISHAIGSVCHINHGNVLAAILIPCMEFNKNKLDSLYSKLLFYISDEDIYSHTSTDERTNMTIYLLKSLLDNLKEKAKIPLRLRDLGVKQEMFNEIAILALDDGAMITEPNDINKNDIVTILNNSY